MDIDISPLLRRCLDAADDELAVDFRGVLSRGTVARCVEESAEWIGERPTVGPNFIPSASGMVGMLPRGNALWVRAMSVRYRRGGSAFG